MNNRKRSNLVRVYRFDLKIELEESIDEKIKKFVRDILEEEFNKRDYEIAVVLSSNNYIKKLNKQYLEHNYPTDILCFPYSRGEKLVSDIIISVEKAKTQAEIYNNSFEGEIFFLVSHGILHLLGWDDSTPEKRKKMWTRQKELLKKFVP